MAKKLIDDVENVEAKNDNNNQKEVTLVAVNPEATHDQTVEPIAPEDLSVHKVLEHHVKEARANNNHALAGDLHNALIKLQDLKNVLEHACEEAKAKVKELVKIHKLV